MTDSSLSLEPWKVDPLDVPPAESSEDRARFFLRYAILAPSSHNSQPWAFDVHGDVVELRPDPTRWLRVADADRRELHISVGCALENLLLASRRFGHRPLVEILSGTDEGPGVRVTLGAAAHEPGAQDVRLFEAIRERRTSHQTFTDRPVDEALVRGLAQAAEDVDVRLVPVPAGPVREAVAELQRRADERQMADEAYREELGHWIGSGALGAGWPQARIAQWVVTHFDLGPKEGKDNANDLREAPVVAVLATEGDDPAARFRVGRAWQRIALTATSGGAATHPLSQILEVPDLKAALAGELELGNAIPQHLFRVGYPAKASTHTPRWPLERFLEGP